MRDYASYTADQLNRIAAEGAKLGATHARIATEGNVKRHIPALDELHKRAGEELDIELGTKPKERFIPLAEQPPLDMLAADVPVPASNSAIDARLRKAKAAQDKRLAKAPMKEKDKTTTSLSAGVARSWDDAAVRKARSTKNKVVVDGGTEYRSVAAAFVALGLPMKEHVAFRGILKRNERARDYDHKWQIVKA